MKKRRREQLTMNTDMHNITSLSLNTRTVTQADGGAFKVINITAIDGDGVENTFKFFTRDETLMTAQITLVVA